MDLDVAIIDYKISNMFSVNSACDYCGLHSEITNDRDKILNARSAILPGVGAFASGMEHLKSLGLIPVIAEFIKTGKPFMGICLGMQLLFTQSEEFGLNEGLNIIPGQVKKFPPVNEEGQKIKVPHIGWSRIQTAENDPSGRNPSPLRGIEADEYMYFVHSYYVVPESDCVVLTVTDYENIRFCSSLVYENIFATQFHPEKSGNAGLKIIQNFAQALNNRPIQTSGSIDGSP